MKIELIPILSDNYVFLLTDLGNDTVAVVDPGEAAPVISALEERGLRLTHILNTHHHWDHTNGNKALKQKYNCKIIGPAADAHRIHGLDTLLKEGDTYMLGNHTANIIETPGHTTGHIVFWFENDAVAFVGDTLFAMGCGRLFEGTPEQMWNSLRKLKALPDNTTLYCAHEYTQNNAEFCLTIEPGNTALKTRYEDVKKKREAGQPTIPTTMALEKATNSFLRANDSENFAEIRRHKDNFKG